MSSNKNTHPCSSSDFPPIPKEIWGLGSAVFFVNLASVMVRSFMTIYMKSLGYSGGWIATMNGITEMTSYLMKILSGVFSDYLRQRKFIIVLGYSLVFISRPIFALTSSVQGILLSRMLERLGNGIQASPRDALVGDLSPKSIRGACYGLKNSLATAGSFTGATLGLGIMFCCDDYNLIFWLAMIPAGIAVLIMAFCVKEPVQNISSVEPQRQPINLSDFKRLGKNFWMLMIVVAIFMIAQLGEWIMVLHAHESFDLPGKLTPLIMIMFNFTYSLMSYPAGCLSDKFGRYTTLAIGFTFLILGDFLLAKATSLTMVFLGIAFCGAQIGVTQSIFMSLITDSVPKELRGTGFGVFYFICAISVFISNYGLGDISDTYGKETAFYISMGVAIISLIILLLIRPSTKNSAERGSESCEALMAPDTTLIKL